MKTLVLTLLTMALVPAIHAAPSPTVPESKPTKRCGWYENPTPGNATLFDKDGEWTLGVQGEFQAQGPRPHFPPDQWVSTNHGGHGYGCACLTLVTKEEEDDGLFSLVDDKVVRVTAALPKPLSACRNDKAISGLEESRLKTSLDDALEELKK